MMTEALSAYLHCRVFTREGRSSLGVDAQAAHSAPSGECLRVDYGANDDIAIAREAAFGFAGYFLPRLMCAGKSGRIFHDVENCGVIGFEIPGHAHGVDPMKARANG